MLLETKIGQYLNTVHGPVLVRFAQGEHFDEVLIDFLESLHFMNDL